MTDVKNFATFQMWTVWNMYQMLSYCLDELKNTTGNVSVNAQPTPHLYHVLYVDQSTCLGPDSQGEGEGSTETQEIQYTIQLLNPDSLGNPTEHFGDDETGRFLCQFIFKLIWLKKHVDTYVNRIQRCF